MSSPGDREHFASWIQSRGVEEGKLETGGTGETVAVVVDEEVKTGVTDVEEVPEVEVVTLVIGLIPLASLKRRCQILNRSEF